MAWLIRSQVESGRVLAMRAISRAKDHVVADEHDSPAQIWIDIERCWSAQPKAAIPSGVSWY